MLPLDRDVDAALPNGSRAEAGGQASLSETVPRDPGALDRETHWC